MHTAFRFSRVTAPQALPLAMLACTLGLSPVAAGAATACSDTTALLREACNHAASEADLRARSLCINLPGAEQRAACQAAAKAALGSAQATCEAQQNARTALCGSLGEQRYAPDVNPAHFDADFRHLTRPNPYFPLGIGNQWRYGGGGEQIAVSVQAETKLIQGLRCISVHDRVDSGGQVVENTYDWYAQRKDGTVLYCGEISRSYEVFDGDQPPVPELVNISGSWKAGRNGDLPGVQFQARPVAGTTYRQEFSPGTAEDAAQVLSVAYGLGTDPALDEGVPPALARLLCAANDCVVTGEFTPLSPGAYERKYYARGIGLFLEVEPGGGAAVRLLECNMDPRCAGLAALAAP